jgi:DNA-binding MarR family transcriptional regulator
VLAQIVGVAPSTLSRRVRRLIDRGWVARRATGRNGRSWVATITPEGREALAAAHPAFVHNHRLLDAALRRRGVEPEVLRRQMQLLSATLRGLLPDAENRDEPAGPAVETLTTPVTSLPTPVRE